MKHITYVQQSAVAVIVDFVLAAHVFKKAFKKFSDDTIILQVKKIL